MREGALKLKQLIRWLEAKAIRFENPSLLFAAGTGIVFACLALMTRLFFAGTLYTAPYVVPLLAVFLSAWLVSFRAAISCLALLILGQVYYFIPPLYSFDLSKTRSSDIVGLLGFGIIALIMATLLSSRRQARAEVEISKRRSAGYLDQLEAVMQSALDSIVVMDHAGITRDFNPAAERMFGYKKSEVVGREMAEFIIPEKYRDMHRRGLAHYLKTGEGAVLNRRIEITALRSDGTEFDVELAIIPITVDGQPLFTGYLRDITDRKRFDRQRDDFIRMASHELKTPITGAKINAQTLRRRLHRNGDVMTATFLTPIVTQLDRMTGIINSLLDLSRAETGRMVLQRSPGTLHTVVLEAVDTVRATGPEQMIEVEWRGSVTCAFDHVRIGQVITNLLTNAVKFSPGSTTIVARCFRDGTQTRVEVIDQGIGIEASEQSKIFERYHRVYNGKSEDYSGLGIGLYLASEIIKAHGGSIGVASQRGKGSTFYFTLPHQEG